MRNIISFLMIFSFTMVHAQETSKNNKKEAVDQQIEKEDMVQFGKNVQKNTISLLPFSPAQGQSDPPPSSLQVLGVFFTKTSYTNVFSKNPLLNGPLNGRLYGSNGSSTYRPNEQKQAFTEMRYLSFLNYSPAPMNGRLILRAAFEVDFAFGDLSNTQQGNVGGAFNGDTVNLQTKRLNAKWVMNSNWNLVVGLQPLADNALDPASALPTDILYGGTKMIFWGSDAAGFTLFGKMLDRKLSSRLGHYTLYANNLNKPDDVTLTMLDLEWSIFDPMKAGLHLWYLKDRSQGKGTAFGVGPTSQLADYHGAITVNSMGQAADIDALWLAIDGSYSRWMTGGPLSLSGFVAMNWADIKYRAKNASISNLDPNKPTGANLFALMAQGDGVYRWGKGDGDHINISGIYATGDQNQNDQTLSSVLTGNQYGFPGSLYLTHRSLLLFPDPRAINRQMALVYDPSNLGYGVMGTSFNVAGDLIPELLNLKLGTALAGSAAKPVNTDRFIGWELNAELLYRPLPFFWIGVHAGYVKYGKFVEVKYNSVPGSEPWVAYATMTWLHF